MARYLSAPTHCAPRHAPSDIDAVRAAIRPCDVLLVEGRSRFSSAIKFLTHSVWSHAALYVGPGMLPGDHCFVEADVVDGVRTVGFDEYVGYGLRICRARSLSAGDAQAVIDAARQRVGHRYDLRNIVDLLRYLWPTPPVPGHLRRRLLALGSGDPTRAICSSLIAQCFQSV
ncbi:MAG: lipo-like protein, partial [Burkholderiales bacterium]|nr:lipo-like protein [Burkholderiales bacterium]